METTQLLIIGGGPGGYAAAFHAADLGLQVTLVEAEERLGGVCLLRGCIPSKALLHVARLLTEAKEAAAWGVHFDQPRVVLDELRRWKAQVVEQLTDGVALLGKRRGVRRLRARARFLDSRTVALEALAQGVPDKLQFEQAILASGSLPAVPSSLAVADPRVMGSDEALDLPEVPRRLLVIGGGYVGLELSTVYAALGSKVSVVELTGTLLPGVDRDLVRPLQKRLDRALEALYLSTRVGGIEPRPEGLLVQLKGQGVPAQQLFDRVLLAVGRRPNTSDLGLEHTRIELDAQGFVRVDRQQRTSDPRILAIGDVAGQPMLAHKAMREGQVAAEVLAGEPAAFDNRAIPAVVFTDPEIAWCGLTEEEAVQQGLRVQTTTFPWVASGRARTLGRTEGLTKLLFDPPSGRLLGMGIVGPGAGELIAEGVLAIEMGAVARDLAETIHTHPTLAETVGEAAETFFGQAIHFHGGKPRAVGDGKSAVFRAASGGLRPPGADDQLRPDPETAG